jgi:hypothetical protein
MGIDSHLSTCVCTQSPKYLEMAQGHISLSIINNNIVEVIFTGKFEVQNRSELEFGFELGSTHKFEV